MGSADVLNYSLSFLLVITGIGFLVILVVITGLLLALKELVNKMKDATDKVVTFEQRAKRGVMNLLLNVLDFISERR